MKIGLVLERFDPARGGLEHWTWQFARELLLRGHEVHVVAFELHPAAEEGGLQAHPLGEMPSSRLDRAELIAARLPALRFDVVHDMGIGWHADIFHPHGGSTVALWEQNLRRIPKWRQIRFWRERRYRELAEVERRQLEESTALIVAVSHMVQRHFETLHHLPAARLRVIPNGVDVARFTPQHRATLRAETRRELSLGEEVLFLMLAHNLLLKNAEVFLRAAAKLVASGAPVRLVIAGGKKPEQFVRLAKKLGIARAVSFSGLVDPIPLYAAADVFVHPTWYDPCSLVTLEASASGLPEGRGVPANSATALKYFLLAAEDGDMVAQLGAARLYAAGKGIPQNLELAFKWYKPAAAQGVLEAQLALASAYADGSGVEADPKEAYRWYRAAGEQGHVGAQFTTATLLEAGKGVEQNDAEAVAWFKRAAAQNHPEALYALGMHHASGRGVPASAAEAARCYRLAAELGHAGAFFNLRALLADGKAGLDAVDEAKVFRVSAEQGNPDAQYQFGLMYVEGRGVKRNLEEGTRWIRLAAEQDHVDAQFRLAEAIVAGQGESRNEAEAAKWYRKAADQGHVEAAYIASVLYTEGRGVDTDAAVAAAYALKAAQGGNAAAQIAYAMACSSGRGVKQDVKEGAKWMRLAADQGNAAAQAQLGLLYLEGRGVPQDYLQAHLWSNLAASEGDAEAAKTRERAAAIMSREQVAQAQELARNWRPAAKR